MFYLEFLVFIEINIVVYFKMFEVLMVFVVIKILICGSKVEIILR